jgi:hypothetical protein
VVDKTKCADCPAVAERREADAAYRAMVTTRLDNYDKLLDKIEKSVLGLTAITQKNFNSIYFRIGFISGGAGLVTGILGSLVTLHLSSK